MRLVATVMKFKIGPTDEAHLHLPCPPSFVHPEGKARIPLDVEATASLDPKDPRGLATDAMCAYAMCVPLSIGPVAKVPCAPPKALQEECFDAPSAISSGGAEPPFAECPVGLLPRSPQPFPLPARFVAGSSQKGEDGAPTQCCYATCETVKPSEGHLPMRGDRQRTIDLVYAMARAHAAER
jgi:hypothetical protein